jgi:predicted nuclease of predicted toxin-antitoxin system
MARLYGNENFGHTVIECLGRLGHDVVTVQEAGMANQQIRDEEVLSFAHKDERAVLTFNRRDFFTYTGEHWRTAVSSSACATRILLG